MYFVSVAAKFYSYDPDYRPGGLLIATYDEFRHNHTCSATARTIERSVSCKPSRILRRLFLVSTPGTLESSLDKDLHISSASGAAFDIGDFSALSSDNSTAGCFEVCKESICTLRERQMQV